MDEWSRPGDLDVFATGDTELFAPGAAVAPRAVGLAVRRGGAAVLDMHARPGHRLGTPIAPSIAPSIATSSGRRTGRFDVVRPVLIDPRRAVRLAQQDLFDEPAAGLTLDRRQPDAERRYLVWSGRLAGRHLGSVSVTLHLLASPSLVVTVLELVPQTRIRWQHQAFIRAGVEAVDVLADRLISARHE